MSESSSIVITCEHGGNLVPPQYVKLFKGAAKILESHRGWDPHALDVARILSRRLEAPLHYSKTTRLLVDLNRSLGHPRLFSEFTRDLEKQERESILTRYYTPYRQAVREQIDGMIATSSGSRINHISVHSFTHCLNGEVRNTEIGLLYDPRRKSEITFAKRLKEELSPLLPGVRIRMNYPYRGNSVGFVTEFRDKWSDRSYLGLELELNQKWLKELKNQGALTDLARKIGLATKTALTDLSFRQDLTSRKVS